MEEVVSLLATAHEVLKAIEMADFDYLDLLTPHLKQELAEFEGHNKLTEVVASEVSRERLHGRQRNKTK